MVSFENIRTGPFKALALKLRDDTKFFFGKHKVVSVALGRSPEDEVADNSHLLSKYLKGAVFLACSNKSKDQLEKVLTEEAEKV